LRRRVARYELDLDADVGEICLDGTTCNANLNFEGGDRRLDLTAGGAGRRK